jgi:hypothetical protein
MNEYLQNTHKIRHKSRQKMEYHATWNVITGTTFNCMWAILTGKTVPRGIFALLSSPLRIPPIPRQSTLTRTCPVDKRVSRPAAPMVYAVRPGKQS